MGKKKMIKKLQFNYNPPKQELDLAVEITARNFIIISKKINELIAAHNQKEEGKG